MSTIRHDTPRSRNRAARRAGLTTFRQQRKAKKFARRMANGKNGAR